MKHAGNTRSAQTRIDFDRERLASEIIDDILRTNASTAVQRIMNEMQ
jgi:hypothetical protein